MPLQFIFKKPPNKPELRGKQAPRPTMPDDAMCEVCPSCKRSFFRSDLEDNYFICPKCGLYHRASARVRVQNLSDEDSFVELFEDLESVNRIDFPFYEEKLEKATLQSGEKEAVICGICEVNGQKTALFVMDPQFMMGSMGSVVGEKITRLFEYAIDHSLPVVGYTVSGGARMQEGILSLMQMAKTAAVIKRHSEVGLLYIVVLTDPTTGGVTASFAMLGDIILAEPKALIGFAGPRVIEQTIRQRLPQGFQKSEFLLEKGFVDKIVARGEQKDIISKLISMHTKGGRN